MADLGSAKVKTPGSRAADSNDEKAKSNQRTTAVPLNEVIGHESAKKELLSVGLTELLDLDDRPVFILDITSATRSNPVYYNPSLREITILELKIGKGIATSSREAARDPTYLAFSEWATSTRNGDLSDATYCGLRWNAKTIRGRWRVISGDVGHHDTGPAAARRQSEIPRLGRTQTQTFPLEPPGDQSRPTYPPRDKHDTLEAQLAQLRLRSEENIQTFPSLPGTEPRFSRKVNTKESETLGRIDFTRPNPSAVLSSHIQFVLDFDWGATLLGPIHSWPPELRRMANILMSDPRPAAMYWGKQRTMMYNEAYLPVIGQKHPGVMGKLFSEAWAEVEKDFTPAFEKAAETGTPFVIDEARFYIQRNGYLEETYHSISIIPFSVDHGEVGFYNPVLDVTRTVIADRRMAFLLRLGQYIASSREPKDFWQQLLRGLEADHLDLPFGILYSAGGDVNETLSESFEQGQFLRNWVLEGLVRVPEPCSALPRRITDEQTMERFLPNFYDLVKADDPTLLLKDSGSLPEFISRDIPVMNGEQTCDAAIFLPIRSTGDNVLGFLVLGLNPRKKYDDDYKVFIELLSRQLATSMASAVLFEEEIHRGRVAAKLAAQDRNLLSKKLAVQTHEALELESRFRRMADLAPVGMFHIDISGILVYANDNYYALTGHPRDVSYPMSWYNVIHEEDFSVMDQEWAKLLRGESVSFELRLRQPFILEELIAGEKVEGSTWLIAAAYPEKAQDGTVTGMLGCLTDISRQKWVEGFQTRRMLEAVELRRQQENFIDMTSHEMRNPLSAIVQCADWIGTSLTEFEDDSNNVVIPREMIDGYVEAAQTIFLCAQHQKRIIDDVLTLSKLDSDLLLITPVEVQPISVVQSSLKIFDSELQKSDMELRFCVEASYTDLAVDWVKLDPSRVLQVLINLTTNAIKFTQSETKREICISIGASIDQPQSGNGIEYLPRSTNRKDMSLGTAWGSGDEVYLHIEVSDSGRGLDENEMTLLFRRFSQASPRTHVQYGGSGLGLFISRELTELQGGQVGVASKAGLGSTFAFYVRARRCAPPEDSTAVPAHTVDKQAKMISPAGLARIKKTPDHITKTGTASPSALSPPPKFVLIVEDNIVNQKVLSKQLRSAGCIVSVANHGGEALAFLQTSRFWKGRERDGEELSVVLMDLEMPVMDGLTCVKKIRQLQTEGTIVSHIPVIAVTANARSEQIIIAKDAGMDSVVTKPFRIPELLPEIDRQMKKGMGRQAGLERSASAPL